MRENAVTPTIIFSDGLHIHTFVHVYECMYQSIHCSMLDRSTVRVERPVTGFGLVVVNVLFTSLLDWFDLPSPCAELRPVFVLSLFTWMSRVVLGHCMLSKARGDTRVDARWYDLLYIVPFCISSIRLL